MGSDKETLKQKLLEIYPEISKFGLTLELSFDEAKNAWVVTFQKGPHQRHAFLDKGDADACMKGTSCIYLGMLISQYIKDMEMIVS